jgi:hypothetical protein
LIALTAISNYNTYRDNIRKDLAFKNLLEGGDCHASDGDSDRDMNDATEATR